MLSNSAHRRRPTPDVADNTRRSGRQSACLPVTLPLQGARTHAHSLDSSSVGQAVGVDVPQAEIEGQVGNGDRSRCLSEKRLVRQ